MKVVSTVLLLCLFLEIASKGISSTKEKNLRKLNETGKTNYSNSESDSFIINNETSTDSGTILPDNANYTNNTNYTDYTNYTAPPIEEPENINATADNTIVNSTKPVSTIPKTTENKMASVQVIKFHSFKAPSGQGKVTFGVYFYFLERPIVESIIMRLRITYSQKLRNLQDSTIAESVRTDCELVNKSYAGSTPRADKGEKNYYCELNATAGNASTASYSLNTDIPMIMINNNTIEVMNFSEVNFNGDSAIQSSKIQESTKEINMEAFSLRNAIVNVDKYNLAFEGYVTKVDYLRRLENIYYTVTMNFLDISNNIKTYSCLVYITDNEIERPDGLICNTSENPIKTTARKLHLSSGYNFRDDLFTIKMEDFNSTSIISTEVNDTYIPQPAEEHENNTTPTQSENVNSTTQDYTVISPEVNDTYKSQTAEEYENNTTPTQAENVNSTTEDYTVISTEVNDTYKPQPTEEYESNTSPTQAENENSTTKDYIPPPAEEYKNNTTPTQAENANSTTKDYTVNSNKPVSTKGYKNDSKTFNIQVMKFHSFNNKESGKINFNTLFYFFNKTIPFSIIYRLRITYQSRRRNLQTGEADSVRTDCTITNESLVGGLNKYDGTNVNYNCKANAKENRIISNVQLNTDLNMILSSKTGDIIERLDFNEISFNGNTTDEAKSIQKNIGVINGQATLKDTTASIKRYILKLTGNYKEESFRLLRRLALVDGQNITMNLKTENIGIHEYNCEFNKLSATKAELECDTEENPINTTVENLHLSNGQSADGTFLTVEMQNWRTNGTQSLVADSTRPSSYKSSGGLSKGGIAGIVIASVAVLLGVAFLTFALRKKAKPPLNNTIGIGKSDSTVNI